MKPILLFGLCLSLLTGCTSINPILSTQLLRSGVATGVSYGVSRYPQSVPGVRVVTEVVCAAAASTNISPANVIAAIQSSGVELTPETTLIVNGALLLYTGVWNAYGENAVNNPALKPYLQATCDGMKDGLPSTTAKALEMKVDTRWPVLRAR